MSERTGATFILGTSGQVGRALRGLLDARGVRVVSERIDLSRPKLIRQQLDELWRYENPESVINAAAYTNVDRAESEPSLAWAINAESPRQLALWCNDRDVPLVHLSTDYVYDGSGSGRWTEASPTGPVNAYGRSKLEGDDAIASVNGRHLILRSSWLYDGEGKNFLRTILRLASERDELSVVSDQYGAPTYTPHLARAVLDALACAARGSRFPSGIYNLCAQGETTWHGFAVAAIEAVAGRGVPLRVGNVRAITSSEYSSPARRPLNSRLDTTKAERELGVSLPEWRKGLAECLLGMYQEALR
jgi:dTDP-4-dehydrorhamnose reductase